MSLNPSHPPAEGGIKVIARAAAILRVLGESQTPLSLGKISKQTGLARSTVQRIVAALEHEKFIALETKGRGFKLGPGLYPLLSEPDSIVIARHRPVLETVSDAIGETVDLSVLRNGKMQFLDQVSGRHRLRAVSVVGDTFPLTSSANGLICLTALPGDMASDLIRAELESDQALDRAPAVFERLKAAAKRGYAVDEDDHTEGISAVGILIDTNPNAPKAISVPVPSSRFQTMKPVILSSLLEHAGG